MSTPAASTPAARRRAVSARLAVTLVAACGVALACRAAASESKAVKSATATTVADARPGPDSIALRTAADKNRILGDANAKVWLIEVSDFQCPYCKSWHDESFDALRREYIATGKARAAYVNFPLDMHVQAMPAAEAAMCASAQNRFWEYHDALFRSQDQWGRPGDQEPTFDSLATAAGADSAKFRACTRSHVMRALVEADRDRMERAGVRSTPTFYVANKQIVGGQPTDVFRQALDAAVANPPAPPSGGR